MKYEIVYIMVPLWRFGVSVKCIVSCYISLQYEGSRVCHTPHSLQYTVDYHFVSKRFCVVSMDTNHT
jgi:hypothetical protein